MLDHIQCFCTTIGGHDVVGCFTQENLNEKLHEDRLILNVKNVLHRC